MTLTSRASIVLNGDDVYEDLFGAGLALQAILGEQGFAARLVAGTARFTAPIEDRLIVLYTATGAFTSAQQRGLADAVAAGCGLLAVHASNVLPGEGEVPPEYEVAARLIGTRYLSHGPLPHQSVVDIRFDADHELTRGLPGFSIDHEHYRVWVAPDARVVAWRTDGEHREPIVTVRSHGLGRVVYLQLGHDTRVWSEPSVRELIRRVARWAAPDRALREVAA